MSNRLVIAGGLLVAASLGLLGYSVLRVQAVVFELSGSVERADDAIEATRADHERLMSELRNVKGMVQSLTLQVRHLQDARANEPPVTPGALETRSVDGAGGDGSHSSCFSEWEHLIEEHRVGFRDLVTHPKNKTVVLEHLDGSASVVGIKLKKGESQFQPRDVELLEDYATLVYERRTAEYAAQRDMINSGEFEVFKNYRDAREFARNNRREGEKLEVVDTDTAAAPYAVVDAKRLSEFAPELQKDIDEIDRQMKEIVTDFEADSRALFQAWLPGRRGD